MLKTQRCILRAGMSGAAIVALAGAAVGAPDAPHQDKASEAAASPVRAESTMQFATVDNPNPENAPPAVPSGPTSRGAAPPNDLCADATPQIGRAHV